MKKILLSFGCCLILAAVLVIAKISVTYYFTQLKNSDTHKLCIIFYFCRWKYSYNTAYYKKLI